MLLAPTPLTHTLAGAVDCPVPACLTFLTEPRVLFLTDSAVHAMVHTHTHTHYLPVPTHLPPAQPTGLDKHRSTLCPHYIHTYSAHTTLLNAQNLTARLYQSTPASAHCPAPVLGIHTVYSSDRIWEPFLTECCAF